MATKICLCCGETFQPHHKVANQAYCSSPECQKKNDDKAGIASSKKLTQTIGTTKAGLSKHGLNAIQITGVSIANLIPTLMEKPSQAQDKLL